MTYKTDKMNLQPQSIAGRRSWIYDDTGGTVATVVAAGWATDGKSKGMKAGDLVDFVPGAGVRYAASVSAVQAEDTGLPSVTIVLDTD
jgi:hypothetical protein